jgi:hypothetical protein
MTQFAAVIDLATLDGSNGFRLDGIDAGDHSGASVASAGDVNGDGFEDFVIGAWGAEGGGDPPTGESYVVFGKAGGFSASVDLFSLNGSNGFRLTGVHADDYSGLSVASAGDVNGDGFDDIIVGAPAANADGDNDSGESYVVFGKAGGFSASLDLSTLDGTNGFRLDGINASDQSGHAVASAGDVNGDGFDDIVIGARFANAGGDADSGQAYVVFGKADGFAGSLDLGSLNGSNGFRLDGIDPGDYAGVSVASAGDVNGDGLDDIIIGAAGAGDFFASGDAYVVFGKDGGFGSSLDLSTLDGSNGFRIVGASNHKYAGSSVASAGDINGDGFDDLIIGAPVSSRGVSFVLFGRGDGFSPNIYCDNINIYGGFKIYGALSTGSRTGASVRPRRRGPDLRGVRQGGPLDD